MGIAGLAQKHQGIGERGWWVQIKRRAGTNSSHVTGFKYSRSQFAQVEGEIQPILVKMMEGERICQSQGFQDCNRQQ
jgi:hypothetical protein